MTIEATLLAILREQRETNDMLRRLLADRAPAVVHAPAAWPPSVFRTGDPLPLTGTTCESPATLGDAGSIRVGWQGNGMVGP